MMRIFSHFIPLRGNSGDNNRNAAGLINENPDDSDTNLLDPGNDDDGEIINGDDVPLIDSQQQNFSASSADSSPDRSECHAEGGEGEAEQANDPHAMSRHERAMRHRSRRHRHRHRSRNRLCRCKRKETNFLASMCSMVVVVLMCTAMAEPEWFYISGGKCRDTQQPLTYLGVKLFFYKGAFSNGQNWNTQSSGSNRDGLPRSIYSYGSSHNEVLLDCVNSTIVFVMKCIIMNCFIVIIFSMTAFILDLVGPTHRVLRIIRVNAVFSILSVCLCLTINGLCYVITEQFTDYFSTNPYRPGSRIDVQFSFSYYIVTAAGAMAVFATACNLFQRPIHSDRVERRDRTVAELQPPGGGLLDGGFSACSQLAYMPAPPAYTP